MNTKEIIRIPAPGGVIAVGDLKLIAITALQYGCDALHFGNRQDILVKIEKKYAALFIDQLKGLNPCYINDKDHYPNIMSVYPAIDISPAKSWLSEGIIHEILEQFHETPRLKVNITDAEQGFVPLFTGNLNFIASDYDNYWYLFISHRAVGERKKIPFLIYGEDIPAVVRKLEHKLLDNHSFLQPEWLYSIFEEDFRCLNLDDDNYPFEKAKTDIGWYEGWQKTGRRYRLGIYQRKNIFSTRFIESLSILCSQANIGSVSISPWQSVIIKNIDEKFYDSWNLMLGKYGVSTMHSALEKNWQLPELDQDAMSLKEYLYYKLDKNNVRTEGLTFAVKTSPIDIAASIVIEEHQFHPLLNKTGIFNSYTLSYAPGFDHNKPANRVFAKKIRKKHLAATLLELCSIFYKENQKKIDHELDQYQKDTEINRQQDEAEYVYQCKHCLTVYDPDTGEPDRKISAGTPFKQLPADYTCPLCESEKKDFKEVEKTTLTELV